ncbi:MAG: hypothetical protein ACSLFQ_17915, partial [Thermoanaerobaculia bacterium]
VPLFFYMGADDTNDAVEFDDGYSDEEKVAVHAALGRGMKERWEPLRELIIWVSLVVSGTRTNRGKAPAAQAVYTVES